jgi:hypothetical protein
MSIAELYPVRPLDSAETTQSCLILAHIANKLYSTHTIRVFASVRPESALFLSAYDADATSKSADCSCCPENGC